MIPSVKPPPTKRFKTPKLLLKIAIALIVVANLLGYFLQDKLIFMAYHMSPAENAAYLNAHREAREISLTASDNVRLHGWWISPARPVSDTVILYLGGQGEEISQNVALIADHTGRQVVGVNYRGFGLSGGKPSEPALYADALLVINYLRERGVQPEKLIIMGHSLGSGVATYLAQNRPAGAIMLITPYDCMVDVAQDHCPVVVASWILRSRFDSIGRVPSIKVPLYMIIAEKDEVIHPRHARLLDAWGGPKQSYTLAGATHNTIYKDEYWRQLRVFLRDFDGKG